MLQQYIPDEVSSPACERNVSWVYKLIKLVIDLRN